jgi:signal transduction histidine kinase
MEQTILPKTMHDKAKCNQADSKFFGAQQGNICHNSTQSEMTAKTGQSQESEGASNGGESTSNSCQKRSGEETESLTAARSESERIWQKIVQTILSQTDGREILSHAAREISISCQAEACAVISLTDSLGEDRHSLQIDWWYERFTTEEQNYWRSQLNGLFANARSTTTDHILAINRADFSRLIDNLVQENSGTRKILATLTGDQQQINGAVLLFYNLSDCQTDSEQELLNHISETMAIAISQVQLQQQNQTKTKYQELLNHLSREIADSSDPNLLQANCLAQIAQTLQVDRGSILMLKYKDPLRTQDARQQLVKGKVQIVHQWSKEQEEGSTGVRTTFDLQDSQLCQTAWQLAPKPLALSELVAFPDLTSERLPEGIESRASALLMMPLMGKKMSESQPAIVLGFLVLQYYSPHLWLKDELDLINWIGVQMTTAIIHHQTLSQIQSLVDERTAKLKWSLDVHAKLSEKMRQQIEELQKLNELKDDFLNSMSHELKTPLTSMKMAIKMLRQADGSPSVREKYLNILEQEWNREYNLIKDLLTLQQVESGEFAISPKELNLADILDELALGFQEKWQFNKGLTLKTELADSALTLYTDSESLEHILSELLLNAGKYSDIDTTIELSAHSQQTFKHKEIAIAISNYGAGISAEELPHIFDKFRRGKGVTDRAVPGTGLGLALVKYLVDHLNGKIEVKCDRINDSEVFKTTFTIKLPQLQSA